MKTMQEVQTLISDLQQFYTDVRLLDAAAIERIEEGVRSNPKAEDLCYACRHRSRRCHHCAVKSAFENHDQRTKLEYFSPDIVQVSAQYMEVDGAPYVLELLQRMQSDTIVEPDDTEALFSALSGYNTKLYHDPLTDMYNRRYYEEIVRGMKGPIGVALMDLDDFKVYNDTYGHHAGDMALKDRRHHRARLHPPDRCAGALRRRRVSAHPARHPGGLLQNQTGGDLRKDP